jgi:hypothetical protein
MEETTRRACLRGAESARSVETTATDDLIGTGGGIGETSPIGGDDGRVCTDDDDDDDVVDDDDVDENGETGRLARRIVAS